MSHRSRKSSPSPLSCAWLSAFYLAALLAPVGHVCRPCGHDCSSGHDGVAHHGVAVDHDASATRSDDDPGHNPPPEHDPETCPLCVLASVLCKHLDLTHAESSIRLLGDMAPIVHPTSDVGSRTRPDLAGHSPRGPPDLG